MTALAAWALAQIIKTVTWAIKERSMNFRRLVEAGGWPSSHSAFVTSLTAAIGWEKGWESPEFALSAVFALIVMYDAAGVRRAAGKQARVLNAIVEDLNKRELHPERLKELLGHTPVEVLGGAVLGIFVAWVRLA